MTEWAMSVLFFSIDVLWGLFVCHFLIKFTGATGRPFYYILLAVFFVATDVLAMFISIPTPVNHAIAFVFFVLFCLLLLKRAPLPSVTAALVLIVISSVLGNINASVLVIANSYLPAHETFVINIISLIGFVLILWLLLRYIANRFSFAQDDFFPYMFTLWLPLIMIFVFSEAFSWATTSNVVTIDSEGYGRMLARLDVPGWWGMLIFLFALACIIVLFFSYQKFMSYYAKQQQASQLEQEIVWQKTAMDEAVLRYDNTRAFRHDLHNHLAVLAGLVRDGKQDEARDYLGKITGFADALSPAIKSGNPVLDVLLDEKITAAKQAGILVSCGADIGKTPIDDYDLCILIGNALDNAIKACEGAAPGEKFIDVEITRKKGFLYLKLSNSHRGSFRKGQGYGLRNMRAVVEKYNGSMEASGGADIFEVSAILSIPLQK